MNDREVLRFRIEPGQTQLHKLARGSRITIAAGAVRVDGAPQWLAETIVRGASIAQPGAPVDLQLTGWVTLSSDVGAQALIEPAVPLNPAMTALRALARNWRRRIGAKSPFHAA